MKTGQLVRIKSASPLAGRFQLTPKDSGTVLCQYKLLAPSCSSRERMDVRLPGGRVVWGVPADAFEPVDDAAEVSRAS